MMQLINVKKKYGGRVVLDVPALSFSPGERCALLGHNGSGKSTLLKLLSGILSTDEGVVQRDAASLDSAYMPQSPYPFDLPVWKNAALGAADAKNAKADALAALRLVGMEAFQNARGSRLSGGESQRMALARVLAAPHQLLLLDEPTAQVDISGEEQIESALLAYGARHGCGMVFSSHAPGQAARLAERILLLDRGRVIEDGPAEQVLHAPKSREAAEFLQHWRIV